MRNTRREGRCAYDRSVWDDGEDGMGGMTYSGEDGRAVPEECSEVEEGEQLGDD